MTPVVTASTPSATDNEVARLSTDIPVQALRQKLSQIRDATNGINRKHEIQQQLNRIEPYLDEARAIVIRATDAEFQAIADQMKAKMEPLDEAIADIQKISTAITTAATSLRQSFARWDRLSERSALPSALKTR